MTTQTSSTLSDAELLRRLVGFDSTSKNSNLPIAELICDYLDRPGIHVERFSSPAGDKVNLVITVGPDPEPERRDGLVLSGHMDVVPAEEPDWQSNPFTLTETATSYVGRGACDMKGFDALAINLAAKVEPAKLRHPLVLILTYDEEVGTVGAHDLAQMWPADRPLPRRAVIGEPTSLQAVRLHKGHSKLRLELHGKSAHSGYPHLGDNAIEPLGRVITALADLRHELEGELCPHRDHFPEVPFVALNLAVLRAGTAINIVPDHALLELGFRVLPGMDAAPIRERVRQRVTAALGERPFTLTKINESPPMLLDEASDLYRAVCALVDQQQTVSASYATDAGWLQSLGLDCLLFGPGSIEVAHRPNESLPKDEFARAPALLEQLIERFCYAAG